MKILTAAQMQRIDRLTTQRYGVPSLTLMENAGTRAVEFIEKRFGPLSSLRIGVVCGSGNNGGDGFVVARLLREKRLQPLVMLLADPARLAGDALENYRRMAPRGIPHTVSNPETWAKEKAALSECDLLVDALLGTGLSRPLEGFLLGVVEELNALFAQKPVVAIDLPSGLAADSPHPLGKCIRANASVTFTAPKIAHIFPPAADHVGDWEVHQIGTPTEALESDPDLRLNTLTRQELSWLVAPRQSDAHKGSFGHVLVVAGSVGKAGAAAMTGLAALRSGAGLVTVATAKSALPMVAAHAMEIMTEPLPETAAGTISMQAIANGLLEKLAAGKTLLALGPGIGSDPETAEFVRAVVQRFSLPIVLDADGLNAFAGHPELLEAKDRVRVLTPHPGEMSRLTGKTTAEIQSLRLPVARDFADRHGVTLVLKGNRTLVAAPDGQTWVNLTGNPGMATGGTGDVLTGLTAGLLAQFPRRSVSGVVAAAVYLHGLAGDLAAARFGEASMIAGDVLNHLSDAFRDISSPN